MLISDSIDVRSSYNEDMLIEDGLILVEDAKLVAEDERCKDSTVSSVTELEKIVDNSSGASSKVKFSGMTPFIS